MDVVVRCAIVPRRHTYWIVAVHPSGSRRAIEYFLDEGAAVERLRAPQLFREEMELRWHARDISRWHVP